jgi:hypothetical protein
VVALESTALSLAKTIVQKAAGAWIADRRTTEERKKELRALLTPRFRHAAPEQRFLDEAASELASFSHEFRGLDDGDRAAALQAVHNAFERADLTDRALFAVDVDAAKLASRLRAGQRRAKTAAGLGEVGGAFYDAALDRCCQLYVRAVLQVPAFVGRSSAEILNRLSDLPDLVAARVVSAWREDQAAAADQPDSDVTMAGRPLEEVTDPFVLEVHRPVQPEDAPPGLPVLPPYVPREHDQVLGQVVRAAAEGRSGIAVLVGGSSTGKTRACWEALDLLRDRDPPWRLWHPIDPSPPDAALGELLGIGPRTVVWLNEAQFYLDTADERGERVAARLRERLRDAGRGPVLVLATVWPEYWASLTARPASGDDRHAQARELLAGHDITVPAKFTPAQLSKLTQTADVRLVLAARSVPTGEVIQFLAGAPELLARYRNAPPAAAALLRAAMDARRLGMGVGLPQAFLEDAAPGYLTDAEWDALGEDWLVQALRYTARDAKGIGGPLTRIRPRPTRRAARGHEDQPASMTAAAGPLYRLADYLDQHGRRTHQDQLGPPSLWDALTAHAAAGDLTRLGQAAQDRGLYRHAAAVWTTATAMGSIGAVLQLITHVRRVSPGDGVRAARWAAGHASLDDPRAVAKLLLELNEAGATDAIQVLAARAAGHASLDDPRAVAWVLLELTEAGASDAVQVLLTRDPAAHARLDDPHAVARLLGALRAAGATDAVQALAARAAAHVPLDDPDAIGELLQELHEAGASDAVQVLLSRDPAAHARLDDPSAVARLLGALRAAGASDAVQALLSRDPAAHVSLDDTYAVVGLLRALRAARASDAVQALATRAAVRARLNYPSALSELLQELREAAATDAVQALADRAANAGMFDLFLEAHPAQAPSYRFGREPNEAPSQPWRWEEPGQLAPWSAEVSVPRTLTADCGIRRLSLDKPCPDVRSYIAKPTSAPRSSQPSVGQDMSVLLSSSGELCCPVSPKAANVRLRLRLKLRRSELPCESLPRSGAGMHTRSEPAPALLGRQRERQALDGLVQDLRSGRGRALVVRGETGVGKSALLEYAAGAAADMRAVRAVGVESEMELAFAADAGPVPGRAGGTDLALGGGGGTGWRRARAQPCPAGYGGAPAERWDGDDLDLWLVSRPRGLRGARARRLGRQPPTHR